MSKKKGNPPYILLYDLKTGQWERAALEKPLQFNFTPGFSSVLSPNSEDVIYITSPSGWEYFVFGFQKMIKELWYGKLGLS